MVRPSSLIAAALLLAACDPAAPDSRSTTEAADAVEIERPTPLSCDGNESEEGCRRYREVAMPAEFEAAMRGDYAAQRNVAWNFSTQSTDATPRPIQACAWRIVIMATHPTETHAGDQGNLDVDCNHLSADDRDQADEVANAIHRQIHGSDLPAAG